MRRTLVLCISVVVITTLVATIHSFAADRPDASRSLDSYDVKAERVFEGIVAGEGHSTGSVMYLPFKTGGIVVDVQLGRKDSPPGIFTFKRGDILIVVGVRVVLNQHSVVLPRQISGMNGTVVLRDDNGAVYGTAVRSERIR